MKIPECMTRRPTQEEVRDAARRVLEVGALRPDQGMMLWVRQWPGAVHHGYEPAHVGWIAIVIAAAILDATERAEKAESEVAELRAQRVLHEALEDEAEATVAKLEAEDAPAAVAEGALVYGIDHGRLITGTLHPLGSGWEVWWNNGAFNTRWPTGDVGLSPAEAWERCAHRLESKNRDVESEARELAMQRDDASRRGLAVLDERDALRAEVAALRNVVAAGDALADAATPPADDDTQERVDAYRLARAEVKP